MNTDFFGTWYGLLGDVEGWKEGPVPLSTTRWQHCQGSPRRGWFRPVLCKESGLRSQNLNPNPDFFPWTWVESGSSEDELPALLWDWSYGKGS